MLAEEVNILDELEKRGLILYDEESDLPQKVNSNKHLRESEVCAVMLPLITEDIRISNRELARRTGFDPRTIARYRKGDVFLRMLAIYTNKSMIGIRHLALERLENLLLDKTQNPNTLMKGIALALSHSERMEEITRSSNIDKPVDVSDLLKELENM